MRTSIEDTACGSCGGRDGRLIASYQGVYRIRKCARCGLTYTASRPSTAEIRHHFSDEYLDPGDALETDFGQRRRRALARLADVLAARHPHGGSILDVGAAGGELLSHFGDEWLKTGLEPSRVGADGLARQRIEVVCDFYPADGLNGRQFDVITMMDVIMLIPDPLAALRAARGQIRPGGTLAVEIPGYAYRLALHVGPVPLVRGRGWTDLNAAIHLYFFSDRTIRSMLTRAGFTVVDVLALPPSDRRGALGPLQRWAGAVAGVVPGVRSGRPSLAAKYLYVAEPTG